MGSSRLRFHHPTASPSLRPANTQSWNRYSYVINNPLTYSDPTGFSKYNRTQIVNGGGGSGDYGTRAITSNRGVADRTVPLLRMRQRRNLLKLSRWR
jgi:hypothetical protein